MGNYNDAYIQQSLQYVKKKKKKVKLKITELIDLFQKAVNELIGNEYEVKLYGSHATNLCLGQIQMLLLLKNRIKFHQFIRSFA